jgi:hypothetical protein
MGTGTVFTNKSPELDPDLALVGKIPKPDLVVKDSDPYLVVKIPDQDPATPGQRVL